MRLLIILLGTVQAGGLAKETVTVYAYDSFCGKNALGGKVEAALEKESGLKTQFVCFGSAGQALNQVAVEGERTRADVVVGIDQGLLGRARKVARFEKAPASWWEALEPGLRFDPRGEVVPFDYGYLSVVYDAARTKPNERYSLADLAQDKSFKKKIAIQDPRTSSLGLSFLAWTRLALSEQKGLSFWKAMAGQVATVAPGWTGSYGLFLKGEVDYVVSYTTSPAYHLEKEGKATLRSLIFSEGHYRQVEGAAILAQSKKKEAARKWLATLLSPEVQKEVPLLQWMYPARQGVVLPKSFSSLPRVQALPSAVEKEIGEQERWLSEWLSAMAGR